MTDGNLLATLKSIRERAALLLEPGRQPWPLAFQVAREVPHFLAALDEVLKLDLAEASPGRLARDLDTIVSTAEAAGSLLAHDSKYQADSLRTDVAAINAITVRMRRQFPAASRPPRKGLTR